MDGKCQKEKINIDIWGVIIDNKSSKIVVSVGGCEINE